MKDKTVDEYCLVVEGAYLTEAEAEHALRDPFIEDWVEATGRFRVHNLKEIMVAPGVALGVLAVRMLDEGVFEVRSNDSQHPLTRRKAEQVGEALRRHDMFDEISIELCDGTDEGAGEGADDDDIGDDAGADAA